MEKKKWVLDTNFVYDHLEEVAESDKELVLCSSVKIELDKHKQSDNAELAYKARKANRFIFENYDRFIHDSKPYEPADVLGQDYSRDVMDYRIVSCALSNGYGLLTGDLNMYSTAKAFGIEVETGKSEGFQAKGNYTGVHKVYIEQGSLDEENFANVYQNPDKNPYQLLTNQYIIFYDKEDPVEWDEEGNPIKYQMLDRFRFDGEKFVQLVLPHKKVVASQNEEQDCAIDLLNNDNIPIKFVIGVSGSGKTLLSTKLGIHKVIDTGAQGKILIIRNPIGSGEAIGFLPGDFDEKTDEFFASVTSQLKGGELEASLMEQRGQLEKQIPYFAKGRTFDATYTLVDEAEDLDVSTIRLLGTRLGKESCIAFAGDYKQVEDKYSRNNGLIRAIEELKGHPLVGIVELTDDIRSDASKLFAERL